MPTEVIMPALGMAQTTGIVVSWKKQVGEQVTKGEPLLEVETDKAVLDVESPATGTLASISVEAGAEVPVGTAIALILAAGEAISLSPSGEKPKAKRPKDSSPSLSGEKPKAKRPKDSSLSPSGERARVRGEEEGARLKPASPLARRLAAEGGIDLESVSGAGPEGAVQAADLPRGVADHTEIEVGSSWRTMAQRTASAWEAPHFYLTREVMAERLLAEKPDKVTVTDLLVKVSALTLKKHPHLLSAWSKGHLVRSNRISIGVAVASEDGLTVPVLQDADRKSLVEIAKWREGAVERARTHRLSPADLEGGAFTISNLGMHGVDAFTAIINGGQASILAVGRIAERPVARDGRVIAAYTMILTLGCDHRAVDGARGAMFLKDLVAAIEEPATLLR
jgi:pyruvate dehydrogenase E2 component (dihydrolipoamide acetyltransferase)